ncbi:general substrate transporter [Mrakia frigida]|uniref:sugar porter family MFS transporter n=1 Tax=Mrakia frigida TaxID=29902 RepID=UPI003FCC0167
MPAGSFAGALIVSKLADAIGRKWVIILAGLIWMVGCILQGASHNVATLVAGRVVAGISVGMSSAVVPLYQAEITPPRIRGRIVSLQQWSITWGILIQYFITFARADIDSDASFRIPWFLQMIPAAVLSGGMLFFPESPRYLMDKGHSEQAHQVLADLHGHGDLNNPLVLLEHTEIAEAVQFDQTQAARSFKDLFGPGVFRRVVLGCSIQAWGQLTGMNIMMYYIVFVMQSAGVTGRHGELVSSSIQYVLNVVATVPAFWLIDRVGRRPLLIAGSTMMCIFLFLVGGLQGAYGENEDVGATTSWVIKNNPTVTNAVITFSYLFVCSFAISWGPVSWTYPSEIFPLRVRAKAISISTSSNWIFNFALAYAVPPALENIQYKTYFIFASFCFFMTIHVFFMYPETKGRSLEELEEVFAAGHHFTAWKIKANTGLRSLNDIEAKHTPSGGLDADGKVNDTKAEESVAHVERL